VDFGLDRGNLALIRNSFSCRVTVLAGKFSLSKPVLFEGAVDGSAAVDVGDGFFVDATDENNEFRLYDVKGGLPRRS